ncbi:MAG: helix-turn-helix transcriptional regulator [Rickettsia endosymbiont of Ixodes persulcatus]|nr:helix-turn-helix transcriptional regulator [Rickettsia endosymbiont of Ixodes persulcatus]MCZ6908658.1 helix-turn-helix transcriptional regulator [Rickettsia endosymbiont of Ixodes persulcatus]MCZ6913480.1 helix-turn-helix transcriptional regulator [Rickettsia endosymbiont of Ixodes persulcatus]MCZ6919382.1 helix-turn-helix transcriptional regulator [Rickettsia endosymbiont of Ixodes persulcatus]
MTQADVAKKMSTSQAQIARMESGHHLPNFLSLQKYAKAVKQEINLLITPYQKNNKKMLVYSIFIVPLVVKTSIFQMEKL